MLKIRSYNQYFLVLIILFWTLCLYTANEYPQKALVINTVVDLIGAPLEKFQQNNNALLEYTDIPYAPKSGPCACPRLHQLVFNEIVTIIQEDKYQVCVEIPNLFFHLNNSDKKHVTYWAEKKHFKLLSELNDPLENFPQPFSIHSAALPDKPTITLIEPYKHPYRSITYSAGTQFVYTAYKNKHYSVYSYNPDSNKCDSITIPKKVCIKNDLTLKPAARIKKFIKLLKKWAHDPGIIPYVWGGCSYTRRLPSTDFYEEQKNNNSAYQRKDALDKNIKSGLDCSGMISRAAQACGMPYFFKNSTTIEKNLPEVTSIDDIRTGDIIWVPGHVMVISSVKNNTLIEAAGYQKGFGKVQELHLQDTFENIHSYKELLERIAQKQPVQRLDSKGKPAQKINEIKILQLQSIWLCEQHEEKYDLQCNTQEQRK